LWKHRKQTFQKKDLGRIPDKFDPIGFSEKMWEVYKKHEVNMAISGKFTCANSAVPLTP
jgi:hypothetical protein